MRAQAMRMVSVSHWRKMIVVRCGIDLATLPPAAPHRENGPARIICVGRLSAEKGYFGLLDALAAVGPSNRSEEHTSELQSLMRISYAVFCLKKKTPLRTLLYA